MRFLKSVLYDYVPSRTLTFRLLTILWLCISAFPFFKSKAYREVLFQHNMFGQSWIINLALCATPYIIVVNIISFSAIFGILKYGLVEQSRKRFKLANAGCLVGAYLTFCGGIFHVFGNWVAFPKTRSFLSFNEGLTLLASLDHTNVMRSSGAKDLFLGFLLWLFAMTVSFIFLAISPPENPRRALKRVIPHFIFCGICLAGIAITTRALIGTKGIASLKPVVSHLISPQLASHWHKILYYSSKDPFTEVELSLEPADTQQSFLARVQEAPDTNVLIFLVEALRADVIGQSHEGKEITPHLNALAKTGHSFEQAYAQASETVYSQTTILSGQYPLRYPYRDTYANLDYSSIHLYEALKWLDYSTAYFTFEWSSSRRFIHDTSLDIYIDAQEFPDPVRALLPEKYKNLDDLAKVPTAVLDRIHSKLLRESISNTSKPFFGSIYLYASHFPYNYDEAMGERRFQQLPLAERPSFFSYSEEIVPAMKNRYYESLHYVDSLIGETLEHLRTIKKLDNTIVVVTGDHGELFHEHDGSVTHGSSLYEEVIRVPLIFWSKNTLYPKLEERATVQHVDIAPTILELLKLPTINTFQGRSILSPTPQNELESNMPIFSTVQAARYEEVIIDWPWKLLRSYRGDADRLLNLQNDPQERKNLYQVETEIRDDLGQKLEDFRNKQFSYYTRNPKRREVYAPPKHPN